MLCPRCDIGAVPQKSRCKKTKDAAQSGKKSPTGLDSLCDVERALSESKDSASAVSDYILMFFQREILLLPYNLVMVAHLRVP